MPFPVPGRSGLRTSGSVRNGGRTAQAAPSPALEITAPEIPAAPGGPVEPGEPGSWPGAAARDGSSRHRKPPERRPVLSKKYRLAAALVVVIGTLSWGFADGFGGAGSAESTVQAFLLAWQQGNYAQAATFTNEAIGPVRAQLTAAYTDLDATNEFFAMKGVTQHGDTAVATYKATVDLAQGGQQWSYTGQFGLTAKNGQWIIDWTPSVINPSLGAGDRLAVTTTYAPRAGVLDSGGHSLLAKSPDYRIGVYPGRLKNQSVTADGFAGDANLDAQQVLGQIQSAPPSDFLSLLTLDPHDFRSLWPKLSKVPGLSYQQQTERLFTSSAREVVGDVGTEDSDVLRQEGAAYQPGMTVGLTGFEYADQDDLIGTPTTSVVVVNAAGRTIATLWNSRGGHEGKPVQTTLNGQEQAAAVSALAGEPNSAEIVAVDSSSGQVRVLASHAASGTGSIPLPKGGALNAQVEPGMAFSIVSAAALLSTGVNPSHPLPCEPVADVGGMTFTYQPTPTSTATLASDFADGCGTAFANMSRTLTPQQLTSAERAFGIKAPWQLRLPAFSGSTAAVNGEADVAAQATGTSGVLMSPLGMATVAAEVADGTGRSPVLTPTDSSATWQSPLSASGLNQLRQLMRLAVTSGSAHAADLPGTPVYGQAGVVQSGKHYLSWFVGYRGSLAVAVLETGNTASQAAAALAGTFLKTVG